MTHRFRCALVAAFTIGASLLSTPAAADGRPIQLSLFNPVQIFPADDSVAGVRLNLIYGVNENVSGLDLGLVNHTRGNGSGIQWGPVSLTDGGFTGWQNGTVAITKGRFSGVQTTFFTSAAALISAWNRSIS